MSLSKINDLKTFLEAYELGNITKSFPDAEEGEMEEFDGVRIGLFGITGSGKSSFINSVVMALKDEEEGPAVIQSTGAEGTIILEALTITDGFTLLDTRGFDLLGGDAEKEILAILNGDIKDESGIDRNTYLGYRKDRENVPDRSGYSTEGRDSRRVFLYVFITEKTVKTSLTGVGTVLRDETHVVKDRENVPDRSGYSTEGRDSRRVFLYVFLTEKTVKTSLTGVGTVLRDETHVVKDRENVSDGSGYSTEGRDSRRVFLYVFMTEKTVKTSLTGVGTVLRDETHVVCVYNRKDRENVSDRSGYSTEGRDSRRVFLYVFITEKTVKTSLTGVGTVLRDETHVVLWFVKASDPRLHTGAYRCHMDFLRQQLLRRGVGTMTILTHEDELGAQENTPAERKKLADAAREITGSIPDNTYFLTNLIKGQTFSDENRLKVLEIIKRSLELSESTIKTRQTKRKMRAMMSKR
ncbi:hypothetical protein Bbelb_113790 [Branchiostoma belcheri]|nr:hypothetical protein Bbelb_113790 [Branchiostoma belcheri]